MKSQTRPIVPTLDELQQLLNVEHPGDLPDAVRELQAQNAAYQRGLEKTAQLLDELGEQIKTEKQRES